MIDLKPLIRDVPDFPKPGILFRDITPLLSDPAGFQSVISQITESAHQAQVDAVAGIESRGFIFGAPVALNLGLPFIPIRKPGKLPAEKMSIEYSLEYGSSQLDIHKDALVADQSVLVVDDLLATGGTALASAKLIELLGARVSLFHFVIELDFLNGRKTLSNYQVKTLLRY